MGLLLFLGSFILFYIINKKIINALYKLKPNKALKIYMNFYNDRKELYKIFKGYSYRIRYGSRSNRSTCFARKGYVYMIVNKLNGKCYVVSTNSIKVRFSNYFNLAHLSGQKGKPLYNFITSLSTSIKTFSCDFISFTSLAGLQSQMRIYLN